MTVLILLYNITLSSTYLLLDYRKKNLPHFDYDDTSLNMLPYLFN